MRSNSPSKVTTGSVQQPAQQRDLLGHPSSPLAEGLAERLVLDGVPADADAEPEPSLGQQVDLGGLLGDEGGLPLRQDDHPGDQLERVHAAR